jgi:predicted dinucleotide-utilizing enzyme
MGKQNIALVGLGRIGSAFLREISGKQGKSLNLLYAAEPANTPGKAQAIAAGIPMATLEEIAAAGSKVDIIFDLTGNPDVRKQLREQLAANKNQHTVIAPESVARLIWSLISTESLPVIEGRVTGY